MGALLSACERSRPASAAALPSSGSTAIGDHYSSLSHLQEDLRKAGLESCNLIVAVDFTRSNEWTGRATNAGRCLHALHAAGSLNPYEAALSVLGRTLASFDEDSLIPAYGFGSVETKSTRIFSFLPGDRPAHTLQGVLQRYRQLAPHVKLSGGTSFAPAIHKACEIVASTSPPQYHILLIVCDGQVSEGEEHRETIAAIVRACAYPLSIICVGVGDGPWGAMETLDDWDESLQDRPFDNFQFVPLAATLAQGRKAADKRLLQRQEQQQQLMQPRAQAHAEAVDAHFALTALMEVPEQYRLIKQAGLLGKRPPRPTHVETLDPPSLPAGAEAEAGAEAGAGAGAGAAAGAAAGAGAAAVPVALPQPSAPAQRAAAASGVPAPECAICMHEPVAYAYGCGHTICASCDSALQSRECPHCRLAIAARTRLFL
jgi:E3 ubiquitin-protein ligase RGLG